MANIDARIKIKTATYPEWMANPLILLDGEPAVVITDTGARIQLRVGDGTKRFSELPDNIKYDQSAFVRVDDIASRVVGSYTVVGEGTYSGTVVPPNNLAVLYWNGTAWLINDIFELPQGEVVNGFNSKSITKGGSANNDTYLFNAVSQNATIDYVNETLGVQGIDNNINPLQQAIFVFNPTTVSNINKVATWYFGKTTKNINTIGYYIFKNSLISTFTENAYARLQVIVKRGTNNIVLLNKVLSYNDLLKFQTNGFSGNVNNYEYKASFNTFELKPNDSLYIQIYCNEPIWQFLAPNSALGNGEWNGNDNLSYRISETTSEDILYTEVPLNDRLGNANAVAVDFYLNDYSVIRTKDYNGDSESKVINQLGARDLKREVINYIDNGIYDVNNITEINPVTNPAPYYLYSGGGAGTHRHIFSWYFNKKSRTIDRVGVYAYKNSTVLPFTPSATGRVQVLVKRISDGSSVKIADVNLSYNDLLKFQGSASTPLLTNHEIVVNTSSTQLEVGDVIYVNLEVLEGVFYFLANVSAIGVGDWTNSNNLAERGSDTNGATTITTVPVYGGSGATALLPLKFYNTYKSLKIEAFNYAKKLNVIGFNQLYFNVGNVPTKLVTSNTYNSSTKDGQDTLMIIIQGNGQLATSMDGADPSAVFKTYARENKISWCVFKIQDQTPPVKQGDYWETTNTGWGNPDTHKRLKLVYDYLTVNYNFKKLIVIAGQSMGFVTAQTAEQMGYLPIKDLISIGGVMNGVVGRFALASTEDRKNQIRSAWNLKNDGSEDSLLLEKCQGYDNWRRNLIGDYKIQNSRLWFLIGTNDDSYSGFGGNDQRDLMISSINKSGGFIKFQQYSDEYHASASLWTKFIDLGWADSVFK